MIAQDKFEGAVCSLLFPEGRIPLELKHNLGSIDARIAEIHSLAQGKHPAPKTRRIVEPTESAALTQRIVELRDGHPTPSWRDIAREIGYVLSSDAIRCRYQDAKALQEKENYEDGKIICRPALHGKHGDEKKEINSSDHIIEPDKMISQGTKPLQSSSIVLDLTRKGKYGRYEVPISAEVDAEIHRLSLEGMPTTGISNELAKRGILISWQRVRSVLATTARLNAKGAREEARKTEAAALHSAAQCCTDATLRNVAEEFGPLSDQASETSPSPSHPGVEGAPELAREAGRPTRGSPEVEAKEEKPVPRSISRIERDQKIWNLWKEGKSPEFISDLIYAEGLYYDAKAVRRILLQQGASL